MTDIGLSCFILNFAALFIIHDPIYGLPQNTFFLMALITTWNISGLLVDPVLHYPRHDRQGITLTGWFRYTKLRKFPLVCKSEGSI